MWVKIAHKGVLIMNIERVKKIIKAHGKSYKHVSHQCYIDTKRFYRWINRERPLRANELHRLYRYLECLESTELFRDE